MVDREIANRLRSMSSQFPVISLTGPRQSGKTTLVRATFPDHAYVNLERLDNRVAAQEDPVRFLTSWARSGAIIDEAQEVPDLFSYLQVAVDESNQTGRFILTGSQNFLLLERISQSLAGRVAVCHLMPFGLSELKPSGLLPPSLDEMLFSGGYPVLYDRKVSPQDYFPSYIQTCIERDVRSIVRLGDLRPFQQFVRLCAGRVGQLVNLSSMGSEIGVSYKTVSSWISILEAAFILHLLPPHHRNFNKRVVKQPKLYFHDTGLLCALLDIQSPAQLSNHYLRGGIFESFVISEYLKMRYHSGKRSNAFFWRDSSGHEVDLLIEQADALIPVEIKSGETLHEELFRGLRYFRKLSSASEEQCFLVHGGRGTQSRSDGNILGWSEIDLLPHG